MSSRFSRAYQVLALALVLFAAAPPPALAQSTIKSPGNRPDYHFEAEPQLLAGLLDPPGFAAGTGLGVGFRGAVELLSEGFIPKLNDSVALGFGLDYLRYDGWYGPRGACQHFVSGPSGTRICVDATDSIDHVDYFYLPVVMQWNFWLHRSWSVFGEPGLAMYFDQGYFDVQPLVLYVGGRYHVSDRVTLTLRLGYPTFSLGVSFLL